MQQNPVHTFLIDDDADDREIFAMALQSLPLAVSHTSAPSAIDALQLFVSSPDTIPDIIFLDLNMPKMNGMECYAELRKISHLAEVPICIYSTNLEMLHQIFGREQRHIYFLEKPTKVSRLTTAIGELIESIHH